MQEAAKQILLIPVLLVSAFVNAQRLEVDNRPAKNEESREIDAWTAHLDQEVSYCMETYSDFMKKTFDVKTSKLQKNMLVVEKHAFTEVSGLRVDLRAAFNSESSGTAVGFMFSPGYDIHFGQTLYKEEFAKGESFVKNYVRFHYQTYYNEVIKKLQGKSKDKLDDIASNEKKIERNKSTMYENDRKIIAGDENAQKLKDRNAKYEKENLQYADEILKYRDEIKKLQDDIIAASESLKRVNEYK